MQSIAPNIVLFCSRDTAAGFLAKTTQRARGRVGRVWQKPLLGRVSKCRHSRRRFLNATLVNESTGLGLRHALARVVKAGSIGCSGPLSLLLTGVRKGGH